MDHMWWGGLIIYEHRVSAAKGDLWRRQMLLPLSDREEMAGMRIKQVSQIAEPQMQCTDKP